MVNRKTTVGDVGLASGLGAAMSVLLSILLTTTPASALNPNTPVRQYLIDSWVESAGLPQNNIKDIIQARDGYLWIATKSGLARFDGVRFVTYDDRTPGQLEEGEVWSVVEGDDGALWIGTYGGGVSRLKNGEFSTYRVGKTGLTSDFVTTMVKADDGGLWIGTEAGLCLLDARGFRCYGTEDGLPSDDVRSLHVDNSHNLWVGTGEGLARFEHGGFVNYAERFPGRLDRRVLAITGDLASEIWIGTETNRLFRLQGGVLTHFGAREGLPHQIVNCLLIDGHGTLWIGAGDGLYRARDGRFEPYFTEAAPRSTSGLPELAALRSVQVLCVDREDSLWIGTTFDGLARLRDGVFQHIRRSEGLPHDNTRSICEDGSGSLWIATELGAVRFSGREISVFDESAGLANSSVMTVVPAPDGSVWIGTTEGLNRFDQGRIESLTFEGRLRTAIQAVLPDETGGLWIGTLSDGLYYLHDGSLVHIGEKEGLTARKIRALAKDSRGRIWVGSKDGGLSRYEGGRFIDVRLWDRMRPSSVHTIFVDADDALWVSTRHGLQRIKDGQVATLTTENGLASNFVYEFVDDGRGNLWMTHGRGIMRAAIRDLNAVADGRAATVPVTVFRSEHGLQTTYMVIARQNGAYRSRDGRLWFASGRGVAIADPTDIPVNRLEPPTWVEEITVDDQPYGLPSDARFKPGRGQVEIRYTGLSFLAPERVRFQHKLEGFDTRWIDAGTRRVAYYTNLPPGKYRFRVKACNKDDVWNETGASYAFSLLPHWYQRPVARAAGVLAMALILLTGHRVRVRRLTRRELELERRVELRTGELQQEIEKHRVTEQKLVAEARDREQAQHGLRQLNDELGERVAQRTRELAVAYEDLSAEKERVTVTLRSIGEGVIATDLDGTVVLLNRVAEDLVGWSSTDAVGRQISAVFTVVDRWTRQPLPDPLLTVKQDERIVDYPDPVLLISRTGEARLIANTVAPIRDPQSRITGAVVVFRDITERIRIEEHLAKVEKLESLGALAAGIAHDFNNLLAGLVGYIDLARLKSTEGGVVRPRLAKALEVLNRARGLTGQLLTFARGSSPVTTPTNVGELVRDASELALAGSKVTSQVTIADDLWLCEVDASQISQVIDNLLINARQAMTEGGRIEVRAENVTIRDNPIVADGRYVRLTVHDQGKGIPRADRDRIFDPFFTTKSGGTGLGLAISHSIVEKHGGQIDFDSVEGAGTTFEIMLPATEDREVATTEVSEEARSVQGRVLVMDDEATIREIVVEVLSEFGLRVEAVADGPTAIDACRVACEAGEPYDLVILDLTIAGGIGGVETLERIRTIQPSIRALATSGYTSDRVMTEPQRHSFQASLAKPFLVDELHKVVTSLLAD